MTAPALAVTQPDGSRKYVHPRTGEIVPSVTTILKAGIGKPQLISWAARKAAEYAVEHWEEMEGLPPPEKITRIRTAHEQLRDDAAAKGDVIHECIDSWSKGRAFEPPKEASSFMNQFAGFMLDVNPLFAENEVTLWNRTHQYAGTADWIAQIGGKMHLGDNKTGRGVYAETALQLSALAGCEFIIREDGTEEEIPPLEKLTVLHVRPRSWKLIEISHREENFATFLACRQIVHWTENIAPGVLG